MVIERKGEERHHRVGTKGSTTTILLLFDHYALSPPFAPISMGDKKINHDDIYNYEIYHLQQN